MRKSVASFREDEFDVTSCPRQVSNQFEGSSHPFVLIPAELFVFE